MRLRARRSSVIAGVLLGVLILGPGPPERAHAGAPAAAETPQPSCAPGELCAPAETPQPSCAPGELCAPAETPQPSCAPGELCAPAETPQPQQAGEGARSPVNDPPGRYLRSLSTIGLIALIVGAYFYVALTGKTLRLRRGGR